MNFFEHQDQARQNTKKLVALFAAAVACLIALTTLLVAAFIYYFQHHNNQRFAAYNDLGAGTFPILDIITWELFGSVSFVVASVVLAGSWYKSRQLARGGSYVAELMGGRLIQVNTDDTLEQKVLNVVAEMAIASGTPIPAVYLLEESSINAFAAGTSPQNAAIGVTRGCLEQLNRDQLQGVIAHEFSHILHGDMKLNMKLTGVLHGILLIGLIGRMMMYSSGHYSSRRYGSHYVRYGSNRNNDQNKGAILGLGLMIIGYSGTFFGGLIKAAVSRQREFLADASAVQFTRNPAGISGALKKIGGLPDRARISHHNSEQFSHLFFGSAIKSSLGSLGATHPPLQERIKRIEPGWSGDFIEPQTTTAAASEHADSLSQFSSQRNATQTATLEDAIELIGEPSPEAIEHAGTLLAAIPEPLMQAAKDGYSARAIIYGLLLKGQKQPDSCWDLLKQAAHPVTYKFCRQIFPLVEALPDHEKLPLFELCLPALQQMSEPQQQVFLKNVIALIRDDRQVAIFEWSLYQLLKNRLSITKQKPSRTHSTLHQLAPDCQQLLSSVAHFGRSANPQAAYDAGIKQLSISNCPLLPVEHISLPRLDSALKQLRQLAPLKKPLLLKAIATTIEADRKIQIEEQELFRALADCLDCPVPPLATPDSVTAA
ncbi:MAG: M48 family metallopeptidase [Candidatus Pelagadaptatus aseana]|uniref:M48 family metallopeptidase n=1 Tax=Candidatus Pelagadaptatus aseana TaxID=3120508 RepID=UPI0039B184FB